MSTDWVAALKAVIDCMGKIAVEATALRGELRNLAQALLEATEELPVAGAKPAPETSPPGPAAAVAESLSEQPSATDTTDTPDAAPEPATAGNLAELSVKDNGSPLPETIPNLVRMEKPPSPPISSLPIAARPLPVRELPTAYTREEPAAAPRLEAAGDAAYTSSPFPRYVPGKWGSPTEEDLPHLIARCRLKAEATRWFMTRQRLHKEGAPDSQIDEQQADIIRRAKELPDCFLWIIHGGSFAPTNLAQFGNLAGCYDTVATAMALARDIVAEGSNALIERCLNLVAEAQSGLRTAIEAVNGPTDPDQKGVYDWLRQKAGQKQIYIPRYMRGEDRADPGRWEGILTRLTALENDLKQHRKRDLSRKKLLQKVRYELKVIAGRPEAVEEHWRTVAGSIDSLVQDGLPPSHLEFRELLLPVFDEVPELDNLPVGFQRTLAEIERFQANKPEPVEPRAAREPSPETREVAKLLEGVTVVLIGGQQRPSAKEAIVSAFGLKDLLWVEIDEYQSLETFEPYIARPDVAVVLLAIRWSRHSFGEVLQFCDRYDKPLVRLPAGYNPNQIAAQILQQCSDRLAERRVEGTAPA